MNGHSYFDGTISQQILLSITNFILVFFTLGIATPWAVCRYYNWKTKHTVIEGKRLMFVGKAGSLFGNWIKWLLLTIITFGIYGFWVNIKLKQWIAKHTLFQN